MSRTVECYFWNPSLDFDDGLNFTFENIGNGIELKMPVFTKKSLEKIIESIKQARKEYLLKAGIPQVLDSSER